MDDGVTLGLDILYPRDRLTGKKVAERLPVLLEQTPYRWAFFPDADSVVRRGRYFVERGYIYVLAHTRGTADSQGTFDFFAPREAQDGVELVTWASRLAGGDGGVGLVGCSATGLNQFFTAARLGPGSPVRAMAAGGMGESVHDEVIFPGGMYSSGGDFVYSTVYSGLGTISSVEASGATLTSLRSGKRSALQDDVWARMDPGAVVAKVARTRIPILLYSGWHDVYPNAPYLLTKLQNAAAQRRLDGPFAGPASSRYQVIMGPGTHCSGDGGGPRDQANLRWFETWMRGKSTGIASIRTPFHFYSLNSSEWKSFESLPQPSQYQLFHLASDGELTERRARSNARIAARLEYGNKAGGSNSFSMTSAPLATPYEITGGASLTLTIKTSAPDALVVADLYDVAPDGTATRITRGEVLASMRTPAPAREWRRPDGALIRPSHDLRRLSRIPAGEPFDVSLALQPRLARIPSGHRLRLTISPRADAVAANCHASLQGPYPCLIGSLPQQVALLGSSYEMTADVVLALPMMQVTDRPNIR